MKDSSADRLNAFTAMTACTTVLTASLSIEKPAAAAPLLSSCDQPASAFLGVECVLRNDGQGSIGFEIAGANGAQGFTFASGTSVENIAAALNSFVDEIGVRADIDRSQPCKMTGVILRSVATGGDAFVSVEQLNGAHPLVSPGSQPGLVSYELKTHGHPGLAGDVNCDEYVNGQDIDAVIQGWGPCPANPSECPGDLTGDGTIGIDDLVQVIINWNTTEP